MKTQCFVVGLLMGLVAHGCSDGNPAGNIGNDTTTPPTPPPPLYTDRASGTINGKPWTATNVLTHLQKTGTIISLQVTATDAGASNVNFVILGATMGSHTVADMSFSQAGFVFAGIGYDRGETGSITIDTLDNIGMRGRFDIMATNAFGQSGSAVGTFEAAF